MSENQERADRAQQVFITVGEYWLLSQSVDAVVEATGIDKEEVSRIYDTLNSGLDLPPALG